MHALMTDPENTQILVTKAKKGDRPAFDRLVEKNRDRLRSRVESWAQFQLGPRLDVDEVLQETFIRAFAAIDRFEWRDEDAFFRWLCGVAKKGLADVARSARRDSIKRGANVSVGDVPVADPTPSKVLQRGERFDRLEVALRKLSPDYRDALLLSRVEGLTVKEIGKRMGRSSDAVKHLIARGLRELKRHFGDTESFQLVDRELRAEVEEDAD